MDPGAQRMLPGSVFSKSLGTPFLCLGFNFRQESLVLEREQQKSRLPYVFFFFFQLTNSNRKGISFQTVPKKPVDFLAEMKLGTLLFLELVTVNTGLENSDRSVLCNVTVPELGMMSAYSDNLDRT